MKRLVIILALLVTTVGTFAVAGTMPPNPFTLSSVGGGGGATNCIGLTGATAAGCAIVNAVDVAAQRSALALGTAATSAATAFSGVGSCATHTVVNVLNGNAAPGCIQLTFSDITGTAATTQIGTGTPGAGKYVDGAAGVWTALPAAGASPAGSGSELQYRASGTTLGALTGSSVSGSALTLTTLNATTVVPGNLSLSGSTISTVDHGELDLVPNPSSANTGLIRMFNQTYFVPVFNGELVLGGGTTAATGNYYFDTNDGHLTLRSNEFFSWTNSSSNPTTTKDAGLGRGNPKVVMFTDGSTNAAAWQAGNANGTTRPTCASGYRGTYWHVYGGAGVADTVAVCCKNVSDSYVWSTAFMSSGTCS